MGFFEGIYVATSEFQAYGSGEMQKSGIRPTFLSIRGLILQLRNIKTVVGAYALAMPHQPGLPSVSRKTTNLIMKTVGTILAAAFILMPWCILPLFSQQADAPKKIVITKHSVEADGTEHTETIIKKGKAAENFDADEYLRLHQSENSRISVQVETQNDVVEPNVLIINGKRINSCATVCADKSAFLGVQEDSDETEDDPGVTVHVIKGSAAEKAGLQTNDVIMALDGQNITHWSDLTAIINNKKPGEKLAIVYERNGRQQSTEATLEQKKVLTIDALNNGPLPAPNPHQNWTRKKWSWDNYDMNTREKEACLGVYSSATTIDGKKGAQISGFTEESAAQEVKMLKGDLITAVNGRKIQGHEALWDEISKYKPEDKVMVEFVREGKTQQVEASLKVCRDNTPLAEEIEIEETDDKEQVREITLIRHRNGGELRERRVIKIRRNESAAPEQPKTPAADQPATSDRKLKLDGFRAFPNPTGGPVTIEFKGDAVATTVALYDGAGRQLYREELNAFSGQYFQQFDLRDYAKGTIVVQVRQGDRVFTEQVVVN